MTKVKICGVTNLEDALAAVEFGADALGFIFAESPRKVSAETVKAIVDQLPPFVTKVGVFMNSELSEVKDIMAESGVDIAQLHGSESPEFCSALFPAVIKAFTTQTLPTTDQLHRYKVAAYMIDKQKGSDTLPQDLWGTARDLSSYGRIILAGALIPENVAEAIAIARPYAVDVASGVEKEPGKKDHHKMQLFIEKAKKE